MSAAGNWTVQVKAGAGDAWVTVHSTATAEQSSSVYQGTCIAACIAPGAWRQVRQCAPSGRVVRGWESDASAGQRRAPPRPPRRGDADQGRLV